MNQRQAAERLGMKTTEIIGIEPVDDGHVVTTHDRQRVLVTKDGVEPYGERAPVIPAQPEPGPSATSPGPEAGADGDQVPDGGAETVLQWVGGNADRASQALEAERSKPAPRKGLVEKLEKLVAPA